MPTKVKFERESSRENPLPSLFLSHEKVMDKNSKDAREIEEEDNRTMNLSCIQKQKDYSSRETRMNMKS